MDEVVESGENEGFFHFGDFFVDHARRRYLIFYEGWIDIRWEQLIYSHLQIACTSGILMVGCYLSWIEKYCKDVRKE